MGQSFYSNGKLLLTGEYSVLDGGLAFALPTKFGQDLVVELGVGKEIRWQSFDQDGSLWFEAVLPFEIILKPIAGSDPIKNTLIEILHQAALLNPKLLEADGFTVSTQLTFPRSWGLGTSSTLINNVAQWFGVDAFVLLQRSFGGSGYDIACAQNDQPIFYRRGTKPSVEIVNFKPDFSDQLYFVYLNQKQSSKAAIANYKTRTNKASEIERISAIGQAAATAKTVGEFSTLLEEHENIMSDMLGIERVKMRLFPDFEGTVKSLGAWGGDFVLAVSQQNPTAYFEAKGYQTVIPYREMIL